MCSLNRASTFVLLSIVINLCSLMYAIASAMRNGNGYTEKRRLNFMSTVIPIVFTFLGYMLEVDDIRIGENSKLNIARHAFSCSMR
jgi:hypothetical protein